ncbi:4Fe-4S single cluster domain-containing protein [Pseudorhodoferax sp.]|uniref:4Fe-4S single cluster domain-containing protein n=1 Tax=Pseudorhodoferax sp. TaxID=1993553 RepID=UPI0039E50D90
MKLGLSRVHFPVTTLGPGRRLGIWLQGCSIRCPGCISADTWRVAEQPVDVADLVASIAPWLAQCDGVTVSGGEPFDQPQALATLLGRIRQLSSVDILAYSGHPYEKLQGFLAAWPGLIDALISDPFEFHRPQTKRLRGSDNQRLHLLTERGRERFAGYDEQPAGPADRQLDVMLDDEGVVWLAGIPRRGDMQRLQDLLRAQGHFSITSEAPVAVCKTPR